MSLDPNRVSSLLDMLPAVFQEDRRPGTASFLGRFLLGFEEVLLGLEDDPEPDLAPGLEQTIADLHHWLEPGPDFEPERADERAPPEFLHWLAGWVALTLREDWTPERQRRLIARAVPLYRLRGTRRGVEEMLRIYTEPFNASVTERPPMQIGVRSTVNVDTLLDGDAPFFFRAQINLPEFDSAALQRQDGIARAIIDLQKPAHTDYVLDIVTPTFQIAAHSTVGVDTLVAEPHTTDPETGHG